MATLQTSPTRVAGIPGDIRAEGPETEERDAPGAYSILVMLAVIACVCLTRLYGYLLFHSIVEAFTVAVACSVFFLAWNARRFLDSHYLVLVGIASLFVGVIDLTHALAYRGMGVFRDNGADLATQLWVAGRFLQSLSLLAAPFFVRRKMDHRLAFSVFLTVSLALAGLIASGRFPACYVEGEGLTLFKIASEYVVVLILLGAGAALRSHRQDFEPDVFRLLGASIGFTAAAELAFTHYAGVYGSINMAGHMLRFVAFGLLYRAIVVTGVVRPNTLLFRNLSRSEEALRKSEARMRTLSDSLPEAVLYRYRHEANGRERFEFVSAGIEQLTGIPASEFMNDAGVIEQSVLPEYEPFRLAGIRSREELTRFEMEAPYRNRATGEVHWSLLRSMPTRNPDGSTTWDGIALDITRRKAAEEALRASEARFRSIADTNIIGVLFCDPVTGRITDANDEYLRIIGRSRQELAAGSLNWKALTPSDQRLYNEQAIANAMRAGRLGPFEKAYLRPDGTRVPVIFGGSVLNGSQPCFVGFALDISERKRAEERLRQTQKLESVGLLAGGIAHDFNNLLTGVTGNASLLLEDLGPQQADLVNGILRSADRAAHLTRQLLAYSGKGQFVIQDVDVSEAVHEMADLVQFSIPKSVQLNLDLERRLPAVRMDPSQLQQILMNLVINAGESIGEGNSGRITVATSVEDVRAPFLDAVGEEITPGRYVRIDVSDTGSGIDPEKQARIFDPFFTTKFTGRGLGLAAVAGIVRSLRGGITLETAPGNGSAFRIFLPAQRSSVMDPESAEQGRPGILVVDDENAVRDFIASTLRRKGYRVLTASDGREALEACDGAGVEAAIVDVVMPNMGANDLLPALAATLPQIRVLLTSGYSAPEARRLCGASPDVAFIQKPYTAQQLAQAVEELFGQQVS